MTTIFTLFLFTILITAPRTDASAVEDPHYTSCARPFSCGALDKVEYPFWGGEDRPAYCGHQGFELKCLNNNLPVLDIGKQRFKVLSINQSRFTLRLARLDLSDNVCLPEFANTTTFNDSVFHSRINGSNFSIFYRCPPDVRLAAPNNFTCPASVNGSNVTNFYGDLAFVMANPSNLSRCGVRVDVLLRRPALESLYTGAMTLEDALDEGFDVEYAETENQSCLVCRGSGGICGSNSSWSELACLCPDGPRPLLCRHPGK